MQYQKTRKLFFITAWILALILLAVVFKKVIYKQLNPNANPTYRNHQNTKEVVIIANRIHAFVVTGYINNQSVDMLLDTGATFVSIPAKIAKKLHLPRGQKHLAHTAAGNIYVYSTKLNSLKIGNIELHNIRASINPHSNSNQILLGMSALKRLSFTKQENSLILRQYV